MWSRIRRAAASRRKLREANQALRKREFAAAIPAYREVLADQPDNAERVRATESALVGALSRADGAAATRSPGGELHG